MIQKTLLFTVTDAHKTQMTCVLAHGVSGFYAKYAEKRLALLTGVFMRSLGDNPGTEPASHCQERCRHERQHKNSGPETFFLSRHSPITFSLAKSQSPAAKPDTL